jgi:hypothetical protein
MQHVIRPSRNYSYSFLLLSLICKGGISTDKRCAYHRVIRHGLSPLTTISEYGAFATNGSLPVSKMQHAVQSKLHGVLHAFAFSRYVVNTNVT